MLLSGNEYCQVSLKTRQNNVLLVSVVTILFYSIAQALTIMLPVYMSKLGYASTIIGLVMGLSGFVMILSRPLAGRIVDQYGSMTTMLPILVLYPFIICGLFSSSIYVLALARALMGLFVAFFAAAIMSMFIKLYPNEKRGNGFSIFSALTILPTIYSSFLALLCLSKFGMTKVLVGILLMAAINVALAAQFNYQRNDFAIIAKYEYQRGQEKNQLIFIGSSLMIFCLSIANGAIYTFLPLFLSGNNFKLSGLYFFVQATTLFSCRFLFGKHIIDSKMRVAICIFILSIVTAIATLIISTKPTLIFLILSAILNGISFAFFYPVLATFITSRLSKDSVSYHLGIFTSCADLGVAIGSILMGAIAELYSYHFMYVLCSVISILSGTAFLILILRRSNKVTVCNLTS